MALHKIFPTLVAHEKALSGTGGDRLRRELLTEAYQISGTDHAGLKWCKKNYPGGYTSYGSLSRLFEMSSTYAQLKKIIDRRVVAFAKSSGMQLKAGELEMVSLWVNILKPGGSHSLHLHPLSTVSGTLYLSASAQGGAFKIEDPRLSKMMAAPQRRAGLRDTPGGFFKIQPKNGDLILFESWLRHEVEAHGQSHGRGHNQSHNGPADRVSVSFNYNWF